MKIKDEHSNSRRRLGKRREKMRESEKDGS